MRLLVLCFLLPLLLSCSHGNEIKDGDLLFVTEDSSNLSEAINRVTQTSLKTNYCHVAIIRIEQDSIWVLESTTKYGSRKILLEDFIKEQNSDIYRYRLKKEYAESIEKAWDNAGDMLGKLYNFSYQLNDTSYYCSDFIYRLFANDSVFELNPMTFIDPQTGVIDSGWQEYYDNLGMEVPQGEPGCNPNGLAKSEKLDFLGKLPLKQ
ncbi:MAG: YiiX/YebB-like N1pC/P60 family cysteine hydrolase [Massilibacteroides sp.]|nr:YiiX/YebB-like N1pC/P60 family cysteine hydrolase [Massilibacteroides sp.]MDD3061372.1 YiiX/YebB-like N1pC/P60 family cysteine hydrolase [Massilibacteroides sp.]MDD4114889.1 YiiX/YebB-like N1pC/P60 family cysteine hydrolase [Massilibacteroides sp.]MDD4659463.1 YiiX/YebB-like N1pC/P60 family cysteine hydrolase [Massilibacteroides sp.]